MPRIVGPRAPEQFARKLRVAKLWNEGLTAQEIADRLGATRAAIQGVVVALQAKGAIAKRNPRRLAGHRVFKQVGRPVTGVSSEADRARQRAAYENERAGFALAKRVVTLAQNNGELRIVTFFSDCREAERAPLASIVGRAAGNVVADLVFMGSGGWSKRWVRWTATGEAAA